MRAVARSLFPFLCMFEAPSGPYDSLHMGDVGQRSVYSGLDHYSNVNDASPTSVSTTQAAEGVSLALGEIQP